MNRKKNVKRPGKKGIGIGGVILTIIIVFLSLTLVCQCIYFFSEIREEIPSYYADENDYVRHAAYEDYNQILNDTLDDSILGHSHTAREDEIRALGYYYEAAALYNAYRTVNDNDSAAKQKDRMERYKQAAGSYGSETARIDEIFGITG